MPSSAAHEGREFASFHPSLARAVVTVLRQEGLRAWTEAAPGEEARVFLDPGDHDQALNCLGRRMDDVQRIARGDHIHDVAVSSDAPPDGEDDTSPLVMERFRQFGVAVGVILAPLLILTLAAVRLSRGVALLILLMGVTAVLALRLRPPRH